MDGGGAPQPAPAQQMNEMPRLAQGGQTATGVKLTEQVPDQFQGSKGKVGIIGLTLLALTGISLWHSIKYHRRAYKDLKEGGNAREIGEVKANVKAMMKQLGMEYQSS